MHDFFFYAPLFISSELGTPASLSPAALRVAASIFSTGGDDHVQCAMQK
jgi:hypothetical protein